MKIISGLRTAVRNAKEEHAMYHALDLDILLNAMCAQRDALVREYLDDPDFSFDEYVKRLDPIMKEIWKIQDLFRLAV